MKPPQPHTLPPDKTTRPVRVWSSEVRMLAALRERLMDRTTDEILLWVRNTNMKAAP